MRIEAPDVSHGADMWRIARDSGSLDLNSSYAYLLLSRDFGRSCRVAIVDGEVIGFVVGYLRPDSVQSLFIWQIAVDQRARGQGVAACLLDDVVAAVPEVITLETTITADNEPSQRLFTSFAERHGGVISISTLFDDRDFPDGHDAELLYEIDGIGR